MVRILLVIHLLIAVAMVGVVLLQRSEGGALGIGGSASGFITGRQAGNLLTRVTYFLAAAFIVTSLTLAIIAGDNARVTSQSILDGNNRKNEENTAVPSHEPAIDSTVSPDITITPVP